MGTGSPTPPAFERHMTTSPTQPMTGVAPSSVCCISCGYDLSGTAIGGHCPECGADVAQSLRPHTTGPRTSGFAIASFVCGVLSLVLAACIPFGLLGIVAIVLYFPAIKEVDRGTAGGPSRGFAIAGLVTGSIGTVFNATCLGFFVLGEVLNW